MTLWHWLTYPFRPGQRRPLSYRQPQPIGEQTAQTPLGLEAIDMSAIDSVNRRNASLERVNAPIVRAKGTSGFFKIADTPVAPLKDDETYAARYHRAYNQKKGTSK